jgi:predicted TIM-barrel fold metal-dependent hydrolase
MNADKSRVYHLISADSHVNEPPDLWTSRMPARLAERAPHVVSLEQGDAWIFEGAPGPMPFGLNACAGMDFTMRTPWVRFADLRPGGWDPAARIAEIDRDQVDAEVLYPTPRFQQAIAAQEDRELHLAMVQAYNDWLSEYVEHAPDRFRGAFYLPSCGLDDALAEVERVGDRHGSAGFLLSRYPDGSLTPSPADDALWAVLAERRIPLNIHVSLVRGMPNQLNTRPLPGANRHLAITDDLLDLIFSGVLERFPALRVVAVEVDCGWVPYWKEQIDDNYRRFRHLHDLSLFPSEYLERQVHFVFVTDTYGVQNRHRIGVERILWSTDYPHASSSWPNSWSAVQAAMCGVPAGERDLVLVGNAARLYGFGT